MLKEVAIGIAILSGIASIGEKIVQFGNMAKLIASCAVDTLVAGVEFLLTKGAQLIIKAIPAIGSILSVFLNKAFSVLVGWFFSTSLVNKIKKRVESKIRPASYQLIDYFKVFFNSIF